MMRDFVELAAHAAEIAGVLVIIGGMIFAAARMPSCGPATASRATSAADGRWPWQRGPEKALS